MYYVVRRPRVNTRAPWQLICEVTAESVVNAHEGAIVALLQHLGVRVEIEGLDGYVNNIATRDWVYRVADSGELWLVGNLADEHGWLLSE